MVYSIAGGNDELCVGRQRGGLTRLAWNRTLVIWSIGLIALASGASLLIGFLTPVAGVLVALGSAGLALSWFPAPSPNLFDGKLAAVFVTTMASAIVFLGPGAFSLDSRLFGRREIFIPPASRSPKS